MTTMGPLRQAKGASKPEAETVPGFVMTRATMAIIIMWVAAVLSGVGAGYQWGWGSGLFVFGVMIAVYGVLLGIGS